MESECVQGEQFTTRHQQDKGVGGELPVQQGAPETGPHTGHAAVVQAPRCPAEYQSVQATHQH